MKILSTFAAVVLLVHEVATWGRLTRLAWLELSRVFVLFDLACTRLVQRVIKPQYVLGGSCHKRGVCCKSIIGNPPTFIKKSWALRLYAGYHALMHKFEVVGRTEDDGLIFSCGHLRSDGRCGIYRHRPRLCRNYPVLPFFGPPQLLPGCGYKVVPRAVSEMRTRPSLPIIDAHVAVHHPTPPRRRQGESERPEDYHQVVP